MLVSLYNMLNVNRFLHRMCGRIFLNDLQMPSLMPLRLLQGPHLFQMLTLSLELLAVPQHHLMHIMSIRILPYLQQHMHPHLSQGVLSIRNYEEMSILQPQLLYLQI